MTQHPLPTNTPPGAVHASQVIVRWAFTPPPRMPATEHRDEFTDPELANDLIAGLLELGDRIEFISWEQHYVGERVWTKRPVEKF